MREGFVPYDFNEPFDLEGTLRALPPGTMQRGMFLQGVLDEAARQGKPLPGKRSYTSFKEYPTSEGYKTSVEVVGHLWPELSVREGLRRLGHTIYPVLLSSMIGKALFGALGGKIDSVVRLVPKEYALSTKDAASSAILTQTLRGQVLRFAFFRREAPESKTC